MKKLLLAAITCLSVVFTGCDKENGDDPTAPSKNAKVLYEASVADPLNYQIQVGYMDGTGGSLKQEVVESPFRYELKAKTGTYCYISVIPVKRQAGIGEETTVTAKMYIDGKLHEETTGEFSAIIQYMFGQD